MTPRERVDAALHWQPVDFVPFTVYETKLPDGPVADGLKADGCCIVERRHNVLGGGATGVTTELEEFERDGHRLRRWIYHTPAGDLSTLVEVLPFTTWTHEHLFKGPNDYAPLLAMIESERYTPNYANYHAGVERWGEAAYIRAGTPNIPIQTLISHYMGTMTFAFEWMDRRSDVLQLIEALSRSYFDAVRIIADSPATAVNLGGNHTPDILGRDNFERYVLAVWEETCAILQPQGKLVGSHLDDDNKLWADLVARSSLDYLEAITPAPDCDLTLAECRAAWPDKVLWLNYPSSVHLSSNEVVAQTTRQLLDEAGDGRGLIVGVTEDVPEFRWAETYRVILDECRAAGPR